MELENEHNEKKRLEVEKVVRNVMKGKKSKVKAKEPTKPRHNVPPAHPLNSAYRS